MVLPVSEPAASGANVDPASVVDVEEVDEDVVVAIVVVVDGASVVVSSAVVAEVAFEDPPQLAANNVNARTIDALTTIRTGLSESDVLDFTWIPCLKTKTFRNRIKDVDEVLLRLRCSSRRCLGGVVITIQRSRT